MGEGPWGAERRLGQAAFVSLQHPRWSPVIDF